MSHITTHGKCNILSVCLPVRLKCPSVKDVVRGRPDYESAEFSVSLRVGGEFSSRMEEDVSGL